MTHPPRLRVALVASSYFPHFGGVEEHTAHVAAELRRQGHYVEVWAPRRVAGESARRVDDIDVRYLRTPLPSGGARSLADFCRRGLPAASDWFTAVREFRPDVVHIQCFGPNGTYGALAARLSGRPLVLSTHGETFMDDDDIFDTSPLQRRSFTAACRQAAAVTACSRYVATDLRDRFGVSGVHVVPNGVNPAAAGSEPASPGDDRGRAPLVVAAGRLVRKKGFDLLIDAVSRSAHRPRLELIGTGPEHEALEQQAAALGIADRVDLVGRCSAAQVQSRMGEADLVVVPSRIEAFGIVVLEAWASETPLVATARGGPADLISNGESGLLVDVEDTEALARTMDHVLGGADLADRLRRGGLSAVEAYSWHSVAATYVSLYRDALAPG